MYEKCLFFNLNALTRTLNKVWEDEFAKLGLSAAHAYLLRIALAEPGVTQKELAHRLGLAPSTVTRFIDALEKKGFLKRSGCPDDARSMRVEATKKAQTLEKDLDKAIGKLSQLLLEKLGKGQVEELVKTLRASQEKLGASE